MAPFSMRCNTCGHWIGAHTKFNARKETAKDEKFYNMAIYRFYIRCPQCAAEITFKTDPENSDYVCEHGASRNFEPWRNEELEKEKQKEEEEEDNKNNPLKSLEARTKESKREMEMLDTLEEIRARNATQERMGLETALEKISSMSNQEVDVLDEQDELLIKSIYQDANGKRVKRLNNSSMSPNLENALEIGVLNNSASNGTVRTDHSPPQKRLSTFGAIKNQSSVLFKSIGPAASLTKKVAMIRTGENTGVETKIKEQPRPESVSLVEDYGSGSSSE
ncbi:Coiled-coil domain-containing protein 94-like protein [Zancudomyces culisetae]|uniref:Coiled-coil domain-containing protein 94-like protein n=1 Tax=Zancudomyces culisetae TaxID=1213189 RepID=A0A1R1PP87_ZANCU|nr:Coiled-coil domain-containing protein 94-like protein [Zancudomyces culisetae]|eukprot:OMH82768.1 Coiled-coil domain-containing protein 94-like protein [Zancudomyces culisetae]